jgi:hypothetical protein
VLRFGSAAPSTKTSLSGRGRLRLWMLVITLGLVVAAIQHLNQPEAAESLDRLFLVQGTTTVETSPETDEPPPKETAQSHPDFQAVNIKPAPPQSDLSSSDLSIVRDNTYLRPQERDAWFGLFSRLQAIDSSQAVEASLGEVTYAQLLQQPDVYRGQFVTIRGTVIREELQHPTENRSGITSYHRLWLSPRGGGQWPFVVFSLQLPEKFPRDDSLRADVSVTGFFFKNWSYAYDEGLGLAPLVLANTVEWQPPVAAAPRQSPTIHNLVWAATGCALFALATVWWVFRNTVRRPRRAGRLPDTFLPPTDLSANNQNGGPA